MQPSDLELAQVKIINNLDKPAKGVKFWNVLVVVLIIAILIGIAAVIVWLEFVVPQPKILAGINLTQSTLILRFEGQEQTLQSFDTYQLRTSRQGLADIEFVDETGQVIRSLHHELPGNQTVVFDLISDQDLVQQCFVEAEVSQLYYPSSTREPSFHILTEVAANTISYQLQRDIQLFVLPGSFDGRALPTDVATSQRVFGLYPVDCADIRDQAEVMERISWWHGFDPQTQRELYQQKLTELLGIN